MTRLVSLAAALALFAPAAAQEEQKKQEEPKTQEKAKEGQVANPEYKAWAGFQKGSFIRMTETREEAGRKTDLEILTTLVELGEQELVLEVETKVLGGGAPVSAKEQRRVAATIPADKLVKEDIEGEEKLEIGGRVFTCKIALAVIEGEGGKTTLRRWLNAELPGGVAKLEHLREGEPPSRRMQIATEFKAL